MTGFAEVFRLTQQYGIWAQQELHRVVPWAESCDLYEAYLTDAAFPDVWLWEDIYAEMLAVYPITEGFAIWPILVFCWLGLTMQECCDVKNADVDLKRRIISVGGRRVKIEADTQWKILATYANTTTGIRTQNRTFTVDLIDQGFFLKITRTKNSARPLQKFDVDQLKSAFKGYAVKCIEEANCVPALNFSAVAKMGQYHKLWLKDHMSEQDISTISTKEIQSIFHVKSVTPTRKMLLTEYQLYLRKLEEKSRT